LISPDDFLVHSNNLFNQPERNEVLLRNVARNSYYALYHKLLKIANLPSFDTSNKNFGSHETLIQQLRKCDDKDYREWGLILANLKTTRTKADYKLDITFSDYYARNALTMVTKTFLEIDSKNHKAATNQKIANSYSNQSTSKPRAQVKFKVVK
jgi:hypothetical protein